MLAVSGASGLAAAAFVAWPSPDDPLCASFDALEGVWDEPAHETIRSAFDRTGLPEAPAAADWILSSLDGHAERWQGARATICDELHSNEPGIVAAHHDRLACLDDRRQELATLAEEIGAHYVLEGSVRRAGSSLRITAQLVEPRADRTLWAEKFSGTLDEIFVIQERVARAIVDALRVNLSVGESEEIAAPLSAPPENVL